MTVAARARSLSSLAALALLLALQAVFGVIFADSASAHAYVIATDPANGTELDEAPTQVTVTFDEAVTFTGREGAVRVIDSEGNRVDTDATTLDDNRLVLRIPLQTDLPEGLYVASWSLVSADTHPIGGSLQFGYGVPATALVAEDAVQPDARLTAAVGITKAITYGGLTLGFGLLPTALLLAAEQRQQRTARRAALIGLGITVIASTVQLVLQYAWTISAGPDDGTGWSGFWTFSSSAYGTAIGLRVLICLAAAWLVATWSQTTRARILALIGLGVAAVATVVQNGHGGAGAWWQYLFTLVHGVAAVTWIGGLLAMGWLLLLQRLTAARLRQLPWWSLVAGISVAALVISGLVQSLAQVGYPGALFTTQYGLVLSAKLVLAIVALALGAWGFVWVRRQLRESTTGRPAEGQTARLRHRVRIEAIAAIGIIALSGVLSSLTPAKAAYAPVTTAQTAAGPYDLTVTISPTRLGPETVTVTAVRRSGDDNTPLAQQVEVSLSQPDGGVQALAVEMPYRVPQSISSGQPTPVRFTSQTVTVPSTGEWTAMVTVVDSEIEQYTTTVVFTVE